MHDVLDPLACLGWLGALLALLWRNEGRLDDVVVEAMLIALNAALAWSRSRLALGVLALSAMCGASFVHLWAHDRPRRAGLWVLWALLALCLVDYTDTAPAWVLFGAGGLGFLFLLQAAHMHGMLPKDAWGLLHWLCIVACLPSMHTLPADARPLVPPVGLILAVLATPRERPPSPRYEPATHAELSAAAFEDEVEMELSSVEQDAQNL